MISCGDKITLEILETNMLGVGVAKVDGMIVFCRGAVCGDVVTALVTDLHKNYAEAMCLEVVSPSRERCDDPCACSAECGGCVFGGVSPTHEVEVKKAGIAAAYRREGIALEVERMISGERLAYRNKAVFHFNSDGKCGFFAEGEKGGVTSGDCPICDDVINKIKNDIERILAQEKISRESLTYLYIRYMKEKNEASVVLGYRGGESLESFSNIIMKENPSVVGVFRGTAASPEARDERFELVAGKESVDAEIFGLTFSVSPASFFQVNHEGAEALCSEVCRLANLKDGERAADIYCGTGLFALTLAKSAPGAEVYGIEINADAVANANRNAERNGVRNAFFLRGDASELKSKTGIDSLDVAVVDPPRAGLSKKTVAQLEELAPKRIVYVSCNPSTLARDVKALSSHYELKSVTGVNMFPRTKHVETVVLLSRQ